jgi:hyaluronan synthase
VFTLLFIVIQLVLAWLQKPVTVSRREQEELDRLYVTVVIPCYNEDPQILDRTIVSLMRQTRLPDHIEVVDDGSTVDYAELREFWLAYHPAGVRFTWVRQQNAGKKHAQAVTFTTDRDAHIFVTIDSDSALDRRAIHEGLKPFADKRVVSVAGLETAINIDRNVLTRAIGHRSLVFQLFAMSAQSVARGSVLINPGAFSLYWAPLIRKIVPAYVGETFFGVPVTLGDDTALTMYALLHGRAVHQPTAVSLPVYPETVAHHLRQWTRWMRASTIRMLWRLRYLPVTSYGWIFTVYTVGSFLTSVAVTLAIPLAWPGTQHLLFASLAAMVIWPVSISLRLATVRRSDQGTLSRLIGVVLLPAAALWYVIVLRQIRFYGIATCWRQGWVTRQHVEVRLDGSHEPVRRSEPVAREGHLGPVMHGMRDDHHGGIGRVDGYADRSVRERSSRAIRDPRDVSDLRDVRARADARGQRVASGPQASQGSRAIQDARNRWNGMSSDGVQAHPYGLPDHGAALDPWDRRDVQPHPARDPRLDPGRRAQGRPHPPHPPRNPPVAGNGFAQPAGFAGDPRLAQDIGLAGGPGHGQQPRLARESRHAQAAGGARDARAAPDPRIAQDPRFARKRQYSEDQWLAETRLAHDSWLAPDRQPFQEPGLVRDPWPAENGRNGLNSSNVQDDWAALDSRIRQDAPDYRRHHTVAPHE